MVAPVATPEAYQLFHDGTLALAHVEANGMRVDLNYLDKAIRRSERKEAQLTASLMEDDVYKTWRRVYGAKTSLGSDDQLTHILFNVLKHPFTETTAGGRPKATDVNLLGIDLDFVRDWRRLAKYKKARGTFLNGIRNHVTPDGLLHANINLNLVATFRSSSDSPNLQNFPVRDDETAGLVRRAIIPRDGHVIVESDFGGIEVALACCYNEDPNLIHDYTVGDMHRDMAMQCYMLEQAEVSKQARYCAKNKFVFPEFYGSYWADCSKNLWDAIDLMKLETVEGVPLKQHLRALGIKRLGDCADNEDPKKGTFQRHIKEVEDVFWNERYSVYTQWKQDTWAEYQRQGWTRLLTGFVCSRAAKTGLPLNRKQTINYRIQGTAFHCLLWVLIQLDRWLRQNKMKSKVISQIHDSIIGDVHEDELDAYLAKTKELMTVTLPATWRWINVPLKVEMEVCKLGGSWFDKEKVEVIG